MANDMCFIVSSFNYLRAPTTRHGNRLLIAVGRFNAQRERRARARARARTFGADLRRHLLIGKHRAARRASPFLSRPPAAKPPRDPFFSRSSLVRLSARPPSVSSTHRGPITIIRREEASHLGISARAAKA